jgi:hypothetical protein
VAINSKQPGDCGYKAFFNGKEVELYASGLYPAKVAAIAHFKPRKKQEHMVSVVLCERADDSVVTHSPADF